MKVTVIIPVWNQESLIERAIKSIPRRDDIEIIVIDDGSTDDTPNRIRTIIEEEQNINLIWLHNEKNMGVAYTVNRGFDNASGEYVAELGSDDYYYTDNFLKAMKHLDGTDMVYYDLEVNDGSVWNLNQHSKRGLCGSVKFIRRAFLGDSRCPEDKKVGEDWWLNEELLKKNPTEKFTNLIVKHYNYPRKGSLSDLLARGILRP